MHSLPCLQSLLAERGVYQEGSSARSESAEKAREGDVSSCDVLAGRLLFCFLGGSRCGSSSWIESVCVTSVCDMTARGCRKPAATEEGIDEVGVREGVRGRSETFDVGCPGGLV